MFTLPAIDSQTFTQKAAADFQTLFRFGVINLRPFASSRATALPACTEHVLAQRMRSPLPWRALSPALNKRPFISECSLAYAVICSRRTPFLASVLSYQAFWSLLVPTIFRLFHFPLSFLFISCINPLANSPSFSSHSRLYHLLCFLPLSLSSPLPLSLPNLSRGFGSSSSHLAPFVPNPFQLLLSLPLTPFVYVLFKRSRARSRSHYLSFVL